MVSEDCSSLDSGVVSASVLSVVSGAAVVDGSVAAVLALLPAAPQAQMDSPKVRTSESVNHFFIRFPPNLYVISVC